MTLHTVSRRDRWYLLALALSLLMGAVGLMLIAPFLFMRIVFGHPCHSEVKLTVDHVRTLADPIIERLESHRVRHGVYPSSLSDLGDVSDPDVGRREWSYWTSGTEFVLLVGCPPDDYPHVRYESEHDDWFVDF